MLAHACSPSNSGGWGRRIAWTQELEVAVSQDRAIALQPGQQEWNSVSKKKIFFYLLSVSTMGAGIFFVQLVHCFATKSRIVPWLGVVVHAVIPALWEAEVGESL